MFGQQRAVHTSRMVRGLLDPGGATEMVTDVAYEVGSDAPLYEPPLSVTSLEPIVVTTLTIG